MNRDCSMTSFRPLHDVKKHNIMCWDGNVIAQLGAFDFGGWTMKLRSFRCREMP